MVIFKYVKHYSALQIVADTLMKSLFLLEYAV